MFAEFFKHALEWLKIPAKYFLPVLAASSFGLFAPLDLMKYLGIEFWRTELKPYFGSAFIISFAIVICQYGTEIFQLAVKEYRKFRSRRTAHARLENLTPEENRFLSGYLKDESRVQRCWRYSSVAAVLMDEGVIYIAVDQGIGDHFPFTISPWAWEYLHKHPHLVSIEGIESRCDK